MAEKLSQNQRAEQLLQEGQGALEAGERQKAHALLQQAAHLAPKDIRVWQTLLEAVHTDADRYTCLQNILRIDPKNEHAKRHMRVLNFMNPIITPVQPRQPSPLERRGLWLARLALTVLVLFVLFSIGLLLGILLNTL